jgi:IS30 family transposase
MAPWHHVGIDFIGPISPPSRQGNNYILTVGDYFTKFVEVVPMPNKEATGVSAALFKIFMKMGICRIVTSDNGTEFNNKLNEELMTLLGIDHRLTTPYHPQVIINVCLIL